LERWNGPLAFDGCLKIAGGSMPPLGTRITRMNPSDIKIGNVRPADKECRPDGR
jgi:hypothetical protein